MPTNEQRPGGQPEAPSSHEIGQILAQLPRGRKHAVSMLLRAVADLVDAAPEQPPTHDDAAPMTADEIIARRPRATAGWLRRHVPESGRGARRTPLYRLADVDAALASGAQPPRPPRKSTPIGVNEDPIELMLRSGELRRSR